MNIQPEEATKQQNIAILQKCVFCFILSLTHVYLKGFTVFYINMRLHSCDYLKKVSIKMNVATDEGDSRNET